MDSEKRLQSMLSARESGQRLVDIAAEWELSVTRVLMILKRHDDPARYRKQKTQKDGRYKRKRYASDPAYRASEAARKRAYRARRKD